MHFFFHLLWWGVDTFQQFIEQINDIWGKPRKTVTTLHKMIRFETKSGAYQSHLVCNSHFMTFMTL